MKERVKERVGRNIRRATIIAIAALVALCMTEISMVWADGVQIEAPSSAKFTDSAFEKYHDREAESLLGPVGSFHLVAFDTLHINAHCNGNFATNNLQANSNNGTNNYGAEINYAKKFTSGQPGSGGDDILVVEDGNTISKADNGNAIMLNGSKLDNTKHIIKSNGFINLTDWKKQTKAVSDSYKSHSTSDSVTTDFSDRNNQKITVKKGGSFLNLTATSNGLNGIASDTPLRIDVDSGNNVVINVNCNKVPANGTLSLPNCRTILKGQELNNREVTKFNENYITWNFTNIPSGMTIDANLMIGSILAPGATVNLNQNLNGTCAADTIYVKAESHRDDSRGTTQKIPEQPKQPTEEKGSLTFTKTFGGDNITKADLNNISFTVTGPDNYSKTFTLGDIKQNDGTYSKTLTGLAIGEYTVTENKADKVEGYTLVTKNNVAGDKTEVSKTSDKANVTAGGAATIALKNIYSQNKGKLTFTKTFDGYNVTDQDKNNITFTVKDKTGKTITTVKLGDMTEGSDGKYTYTVENLTPGEYTVTENNADSMTGYNFVQKDSVTSGKTTVKSDNTSTIDLSDIYTQKKGQLTFTKTFGGDNVTAEDLKNISFEVKGPNNYDQVFFLKDIKKDNGTYSKTLTDLDWGKYTVTEKNADGVNGYKLEKTSVLEGSTEISGTQLTGTVNLNDAYTQKKGALTFTKTFGGDVTKADLSNITFTITGPKGFTTQKVKLSGMTKGNDGKYTYTLDNLEWGTYTVKETNSSVNGYTLDKTSHIEGDVTVDAAHLEGDANTINLTDNYTPVHPRVQLFKNEFYSGSLTDSPVGGSSYALYRWKGAKAKLELLAMATRASVDPATETNWSKVTRSDIMNSDNWEYLGENKTDGTGYICSKYSGKYDELNDGDIVAVMEMVAPAGYQRTANPAIVQVHANANPTMISNSDGAVSINEKDGSLIWAETVERVGIKKVDSNGNPVVGAKMAVLDKDGKIIDTWTTTKDNLVHEIAKLTTGETYTLRELQAPEGYEKAADVTFTAEAKDIKGTDEYVQSVTMIDQKAQPAKPGIPSNGTSVKPAQTVAQGVKTGDPTTIGGLVLMLAAAGAVLVLSAKHIKAMR